MSLRFTRLALTDIDDILTYLQQHSPHGAASVEHAFSRTFERLASFPQSGREFDPTDGTRRAVVRGYPFIIVYWIRGETVEVLRIRHTARDPDTIDY